MSRWNKWKLIHKETGLTFNQYKDKYEKIPTKYSYIYSNDSNVDRKLIPVLLQSGVPAIYIDQAYYPCMYFLDNRQWQIKMKPVKE